MCPMSTTKPSRDNFSSPTVDALAKRAAFICSNPDCRAFTIAPSSGDAAKFIYTGVAAHISAAAAQGPRFDPSLSIDQRRAIENAIFLCGSCSIMIDKNNGIDFTSNALRRWKAEHEEWVRANLNKRAHGEMTALVIGPNSHIEGSVIVSQNQLGGQLAHSITNIGPQPRSIDKAAILDLVAALRDHPKESFDLIANSDPEAISLKEQIKTALTRSEWVANQDVLDLALSKEPGVTVRVLDKDKSQPHYLAFLNWLHAAGLLKAGHSYKEGLERMRIEIGSHPQLTNRH